MVSSAERLIVRARPESTQRERATRLSLNDGSRELASVAVAACSAGNRRMAEPTGSSIQARIPGMSTERLFHWRGVISACVLPPMALAVAFRPAVG